jgi:hypothetical protein
MPPTKGRLLLIKRMGKEDDGRMLDILLHDEILRPGMVHHNRRRTLLRLE